MGTDIVTQTKYFRVKCKPRSLKNYWKRYEPVAAFLPLITVRKYHARPLQITKKDFAKKLLARLDDRENLLGFFAEYNANVMRLRDRGYKLHALAGVPIAEVKYDPLPAEVKEYIEAYTA
jgi:hypothetical protein